MSNLESQKFDCNLNSLRDKIKKIFEVEMGVLGNNLYTYSFLHFPYKTFIQENILYLTNRHIEVLKEITTLRGDLFLHELGIATMLNGNSLDIPLRTLMECGWSKERYFRYLHSDYAITSHDFHKPLGNSTLESLPTWIGSPVRDVNNLETFSSNLESFLSFLKEIAIPKHQIVSTQCLPQGSHAMALDIFGYALNSAGHLAYTLQHNAICEAITQIPVWSYYTDELGDYNLAIDFIYKHQAWVNNGRGKDDFLVGNFDQGEENYAYLNSAISRALAVEIP